MLITMQGPGRNQSPAAAILLTAKKDKNDEQMDEKFPESYGTFPESPCMFPESNRIFPESPRREGDPKGWSTVLVTALGSWEKTVLCGHLTMPYSPS